MLFDNAADNLASRHSSPRSTYLTGKVLHNGGALENASGSRDYIHLGKVRRYVTLYTLSTCLISDAGTIP